MLPVFIFPLLCFPFYISSFSIFRFYAFCFKFSVFLFSVFIFFFFHFCFYVSRFYTSSFSIFRFYTSLFMFPVFSISRFCFLSPFYVLFLLFIRLSVLLFALLLLLYSDFNRCASVRPCILYTPVRYKNEKHFLPAVPICGWYGIIFLYRQR